MSVRTRTRVVVFDVDGVVLDSLHACVWSLNQALIQFGGNPIGDDYFQRNHFGSHENFVRSRGVPESVSMEEFDSVLDQLFHRVYLYQEMPGVRELLANIQVQGIPMYLSSACNVDLTRAKIGYHDDLTGFFVDIYGGERKSESFRHLCQEFCFQPEEIVFVTDMGRDIDEARLAGVENVLAVVSRFSTREQLESYGVPVFDSMHNLQTHFQMKVF